ncbi:MAG: CoA-binding domain-containing [Planctomycetota bacterium]|nr:MAG: CoA-binding domain-containing [Planctomycetota bacterium]
MDITHDRERIRELLTEARTVAVVGDSPNPARDAHRIAEYLIGAGYEVIPVNPQYSEVHGLRCFPTLQSIGRAVDIVDIFRRPENTPEVVEDAIAANAKCVWFQLDTANEAAAKRADEAGLATVRNACTMVAHRTLRIPRR